MVSTIQALQIVVVASLLTGDPLRAGNMMTIQGESLVLAKNTPGNLCFDQVRSGSVSLRSTYDAAKTNGTVYVEGQDYAVDSFKGNLITLVGMIRKRYGSEVILFSSCPPNEAWHYGSHQMATYAAATKEAAAEVQCAYVDVYNVWELVLKRKDQTSLLNNDINHPNDFGHWLYEQAFEAMEF